MKEKKTTLVTLIHANFLDLKLFLRGLLTKNKRCKVNEIIVNEDMVRNT